MPFIYSLLLNERMPCNHFIFPLHCIHPLKTTFCLFSSSNSSAMASEHERPRITEVQVRMDCNGCVQKIKKALHHIPQQKIIIVGCPDQAKVIKAIKKTRKGALICFNTEPADTPAQPEEPPAEGGPPEGASGNQSQTEAQQVEAEPPKDTTSPPPPEDNPPQETQQSAEENSSSPTPNTTSSQPVVEPSRPKDVEEVHVIHHYPPDYSYGQNNGYGHGYVGSSSTQRRLPTFMAEPPLHPRATHNYNTLQSEPPQNMQGTHNYTTQRPNPPMPLYEPHNYNTERPNPPIPLYATHNYNTHRPSPYVTQYEYTRPPPQYTNHNRPVPYSDDYNYYYGNNNSGNITSVFSDENPNSCTIV